MTHDLVIAMREDEDKTKDRRHVQRTKVLRGAKIILPRQWPVIHCTVQNITSGGACLKMANAYGVPQHFELTFESGRTRRACRVVWRTHDQLGVAFQGDDTAAAQNKSAESV
ncbi:MAG: PilZ domain-containing protein [Stellaceae bacterium]